MNSMNQSFKSNSNRMFTNSSMKMNGSISRLADLFNDEFKKKLYADCAQDDTQKSSTIVEMIEQKPKVKKVTLDMLAEELLSNNAKVLSGIKGLQAQKDYIVERVNALKGITDAKRKKFLNGNYGRGGILTARNFEDLLTALTEAVLSGKDLAMPYSRRR